MEEALAFIGSPIQNLKPTIADFFTEKKNKSCRQSELPTRSIIPDRITIILDIGEQFLIMPDAISYPLKRNPNAKESNGWITPGTTEKQYPITADLAAGTRLYAAPVEYQPPKRGGGPIVRTGNKAPREEKPKDTSLKWVVTDEYISKCLTSRGKLDGPNGRPREASTFDYNTENRINATKRDAIGDDYSEPNWSHGDYDPSGENDVFGGVITSLEGSFLNEGYLLQGEEGSPRISLDKETTVHYCTEKHGVTIRNPVDMWRKCNNQYYLMSLYKEHEVKKYRSYMSRTVWYDEPGKNDSRWYCLSCVKKSGMVDIGNQVHWHHDDIELIRAIAKLGRKRTRPDYRLEIHYPNPDQRLDTTIIKKYLTVQANKEPFDPNNGGKSFYHRELVRNDEYLRTSVLTALNGELSYRLKAKGGRIAGDGAESIKKKCDANFARQIPYDDGLPSKYQLDSPRGIISVNFEVNAIRKILTELKSISDKPIKN